MIVLGITLLSFPSTPVELYYYSTGDGASVPGEFIWRGNGNKWVGLFGSGVIISHFWVLIIIPSPSKHSKSRCLIETNSWPLCHGL